MQQLHPLRPHLERLYPLGDVVAHGVIDDDDGGRVRAPASGRGGVSISVVSPISGACRVQRALAYAGGRRWALGQFMS